MRTAGTAAAMIVALVVGAMLAPSCSGTQPSPQVVEALEALPGALDAAEDALEALRPILTREDLELTDKDREDIDAGLDAMQGVVELGRALVRDAQHATERGGWAWAELVIDAIGRLVRWLKDDLGVAVPGAVTLAADAAHLLVPAIAGAVEGD